jgi:hypothetical protein
MMGWLTLILAIALTIRITCWGAHADRALWDGRQIVFFGMALGLGMIVGGAWGLLVSWHYAGILLLAGISLLLLTNSRSPFRPGRGLSGKSDE